MAATARGEEAVLQIILGAAYPPSTNHGEDKGLHERMAELLRNSGYEEQHRKPKRMAVPSDTDVYLEAVETAQNQDEKTQRTGSGRPLCGDNSLRPQRILVQCRKQSGQLGIE